MYAYRIRVVRGAEECSVTEELHVFGDDVLRAAGMTAKQMMDRAVKWYRKKYRGGGRRIVVTNSWTHGAEV